MALMTHRSPQIMGEIQVYWQMMEDGTNGKVDCMLPTKL